MLRRPGSGVEGCAVQPVRHGRRVVDEQPVEDQPCEPAGCLLPDRWWKLGVGQSCAGDDDVGGVDVGSDCAVIFAALQDLLEVGTNLLPERVSGRSMLRLVRARRDGGEQRVAAREIAGRASPAACRP